MRSTLIIVGGLLLLAASAAAQTDSSYSSPMDAVRGGSVQQRSPGVAIRRAVAAHNELNTQRIFNGGVIYDTESASNNSSSSSLSSLLNLANLANSNSSLNSLSDLFGPSSNTSSNSSSSNSTSDLTQMILDMVEARGGDTSLVRGTQVKASDVNKTLDRAQATTDDDEKFVVELADSVLSSFFSALALGLQSDDVVDLFKNWMRPLFPTLAATEDSSNDGSGGTNNNNGNDNNDTTNGGGGIEDLDPNQADNNDSESIV